MSVNRGNLIMRSFIVLLLLTVVFLSGMLIGMDRKEESHANNIPSEMNVIEQTDNLAYGDGYEEQPVIVEQIIEIEGPAQTTQKIASFLEAGVKGFYEIIVEVLFQVSSLFV